MVEPLSVAASITGLVSLGIQVTQSLADYYISYRGQDVEIDSTRSKLDDLAAILKLLRDAIKHRTFQADEQALIEQIEKSVRKCEEAITELQGELQKFEQIPTQVLSSKLRVAGHRVAYPFRKSSLQKLDENIGEIRQNISLAQDILQLNDSSHIRSDIEDIRAVITLVKSSQVSSELRYWLQAPDASSNHNEACAKRHWSTGLWLVKGATFERWLDKQKSFLWINGFAGCGKSVLCSTAIQFVFRHRRSNPRIGIAFFYFSFNDSSKQDVSSMLRALLLQLSGQLDDGYIHLGRLYTNYHPGLPPVPALLITLQEVILKFQDVYLLIDALDESPQYASRDHVLAALAEIHSWTAVGLHILVTSRDISDIRETVGLLGPNISMRNEGVDRDIAEFIAGHLKKSAALRRWSAHHDLIQEALTGGAGGVFRWVECQFKSLAKCPRSEAKLKERLASLPQSLDETYERMLSDIDSDCIEDAKRILTLLCFSKRPMRVSEIIDGIAVELGDDPKLDLKRRFEDESDILQICPGFIELSLDWEVGSIDHFIQISHFSVQQYLKSQRILKQGKAAKLHLNRLSASAELTEICLVYLLDHGLSTPHVTEAIYHQRPLVKYAAEYWHTHYKETENLEPRIEGLVKRLFETQPSNFQNWIRIRNPDRAEPPNLRKPGNEIPSSIYYASLLGLSSILSNRLENEKCENQKMSQVQHCKTLNPSELYDLLNARGGRCGYALQAASYEGHREVVQLLLDSGAEVNALGERYGSALHAASLKGHKEVVRLLLDSGAEVNIKGGECDTALQCASYGGRMEVAQLLLNSGAEVNARGGYYGNALQAASHKGYRKLVQLLLNSGAEINTQGGRYNNALQAALDGDHKEVAQLLLDSGAEN